MFRELRRIKNKISDEENGKIYFHGARSGHKVDALKKDDKVCFTVYGNEHYKDDWAPYVQLYEITIEHLCGKQIHER